MPITVEERELIPHVAKGGCVDIRALRIAHGMARRKANTYKELIALFVYYYYKETDPDGDEPMSDL